MLGKCLSTMAHKDSNWGRKPLPPYTTRHLSAGGHTRKSAPAKQRIYIWRPDLSSVAICQRGHDTTTILYIKSPTQQELLRFDLLFERMCMFPVHLQNFVQAICLDR
jgi:hypothetical protein